MLAGMTLGSVSIAPSEFLSWLTGSPIQENHALILEKIRYPRTLTALFSGAGLALSGLLLQTLFRNPLAGPSVLGISSGAGLGVAVVLLAGVSLSGILGTASVILGALTGSLVVIFIIATIARRFQDITIVLIAGLMIGFIGSALVGVLAFFSNAETLKPFIHWGFGSFSRSSDYQLVALGLSVLFGVVISVYLYKPLNALLPGESFASSVGIDVAKSRLMLILLAGFLTGIITAFAGPIAFIGLAVPQLVKLMFKTNHHRITLPATLIMGANMALLCDIISRLPGIESALPLNAVTSLFGAPIVLIVLFRSRKTKKVLS